MYVHLDLPLQKPEAPHRAASARPEDVKLLKKFFFLSLVIFCLFVCFFNPGGMIWNYENLADGETRSQGSNLAKRPWAGDLTFLRLHFLIKFSIKHLAYSNPL